MPTRTAGIALENIMAEETKPSLAASLIDLLAGASPEDLERVRDRIKVIKQEIADYKASRTAELRGLQTIRKVLHARLMLPAEKKRAIREAKPQAYSQVVEAQPNQSASPARPDDTSDLTGLQQAIFDLLHQEGSMPVPAIAARLRRSPAAIGRAVHCSSWFVAGNGEVRIARADERSP